MIASWRSVSDVVTGDRIVEAKREPGLESRARIGTKLHFAGLADGAGLLFCETNAAAVGLPALDESANPRKKGLR